MELTKEQSEVLESNGHSLVTGGPGSGKTTIAILKAAKTVNSLPLQEQSVLFLSFARATVSRVIEAIQGEKSIDSKTRRRIEVETYHSFFWGLIKTHGYLIRLPRVVSVLAPPEEAVRLSVIRSEEGDEKAELKRLAYEEGKISFSMFIVFANQIITACERIPALIANKYPMMILDEFQDTNKEQWELIKTLGIKSQLLSLADPEQRIYGWLGADPERIDNFINTFSPNIFSLKNANHRNSGTDILELGNDILTGHYKDSDYKGVDLNLYTPNASQAFTELITTIYKSRKRLSIMQKDWSLAILVPTKLLTRIISDKLSNPPGKFKPVQHTAMVDIEAIVLSAEIIAHLLQPKEKESHFEEFVSLIVGYYQGKNGNSPTKTDLGKAASIEKAYIKWKENNALKKNTNANSVAVKIHTVYSTLSQLTLSGNAEVDWIEIRKIIENGECQQLHQIADDAKNLRLFRRGTELRTLLSSNWIETGTYCNALNLLRQTFIREHFSTTKEVEKGVIIMNMHKAKGKQFDEVIVFEGWPRTSRGKIVANANRFVRNNDAKNINDQNTQNLRVSVTRGKNHVTLFTPENDPCVLFTKERELY